MTNDNTALAIIDPSSLPPVVSPEWVLAHRASLVVADVRWYLDGRSSRAAYESGHIDGAVFVDMDTDLSDHSQPAGFGRHPLPSPEQFAAAMSRLGIGDSTPVVAYDDTGGATAGRLVVMLRSLGRSAALLDGGLRAWSGPLASGAPTALGAAVFSVRPWPPERFATGDDVAGAAASGVVLDARSADRFRGESEPIDPRAGHVPGARNAPWSANVDRETSRFRTPEQLRQHYAALGVADADEVICYCGSGVSACADVLGIEHAGFAPPRLYVASWSGWSSEMHRPVQTGDS